MKLSYRTASVSDTDEIMQLIAAAVCEMERLQIHQWDAVYPARDVIAEDIRRQTMQVGIADGRIAVIYVLNQDCDEQYAKGDWTYRGDDFAVLHRLCVHPAFQRQGAAGDTMIHMEDNLRQRGVRAVRLDVYSENPYALRLYRHHGYRETGTADWRKGRFLLMEKLLGE